MRNPVILVAPKLLLLLLAGCGGSDAPPVAPLQPPPDPPANPLTYAPGVFRDSSLFAARCQAPRTGRIDPWTGQPWPDVAGSAMHEKHFLRSWTHELYLWADEVLDRNPANTSSVLQYFSLLRTDALADSGQPKDQFHYTYDTDDYRQLASGIVLGHGISWGIVDGAVPRVIVAEFVQPGSPADVAGVHRGAQLLSVDGFDVVHDQTQAGTSAILRAMFEPVKGSVHSMVFRDRDSADTFTASLLADQIISDPAPVVDIIDAGPFKVGYLLFNDHSLIAEAALSGAVSQLAAGQVDELVLDLRYNGGGYLDIASQLGFMIAGPAATQNRTFERLQFNAKHAGRHPLTGQIITPTPFHSTARGFSLPAGQPLPSLGLDRVHVLTSDRTCSASESIINGLRGIGIEVIQIGGNTCGKPYGFYPRDNCGTTYFSVQFRGVNEMNFGDYAEGFSATRITGHPLANLPGCAAEDDFTRDLGDPLEGQLKTALTYLTTGSCPAIAMASGGAQKRARPQALLSPVDAPVLQRPLRPWEKNRILR